jgi:hypothetical protein
MGRSTHRKQREWRKNLKDKYQKRKKGVTAATVHPSEIQPFTLYQKEKGVTLGRISAAKKFVNRTGKYFAGLWTWVRIPWGEPNRGQCRQGF